MKVLIHIYNHNTNNLNMFKSDSIVWLSYRTDINGIIFSHDLKVYAKNFDCTRSTLKELVSIAKELNNGTDYYYEN